MSFSMNFNMSLSSGLLFIQTTENLVRAAVLQKELTGTRLTNAIVFERQFNFEILSDKEIRTIVERIPKCPNKVVVVSSFVTVVETTMDAKRLKKLPKDRLKDVIRWELEPFIAESPADYMIGYEESWQAVEGDSKNPRRHFWISSLLTTDYLQLKENLAAHNLYLTHVYPVEAAYKAVADKFEKKSYCFLYISENQTSYILGEKKEPTVNGIFNFGVDDILVAQNFGTEADILQILHEEIPDLGVSDIKLLISFEGERNEQVLRFFKDTLHIEPLEIAAKLYSEETKETYEDCSFTAIYGLMLCEKGSSNKRQRYGINDTVPLAKIIRARIHVLPIVFIGVFLLLFVAHYGIIKLQLHSLTASVESMEAEKTQLQAAADQYTSAKERRSDIQEQLETMKLKMDFITNDTEDDTTNIVETLRAINEFTSASLMIDTIEPTVESSFVNAPEVIDITQYYTLVGIASSIESINTFTTNLQEQPWCDYVALCAVEESGSDVLKTYDFVVIIVKFVGSSPEDRINQEHSVLQIHEDSNE